MDNTQLMKFTYNTAPHSTTVARVYLNSKGLLNPLRKSKPQDTLSGFWTFINFLHRLLRKFSNTHKKTPHAYSFLPNIHNFLPNTHSFLPNTTSSSPTAPNPNPLKCWVLSPAPFNPFTFTQELLLWIPSTHFLVLLSVLFCFCLPLKPLPPLTPTTLIKRFM